MINPLPKTGMRRLSLHRRLLGSALLWVSLVLIFAAFYIPAEIQSFLYQQLYNQSELYLDELSAYVEVNNEGQVSLLAPLPDPRFNQPYSGYYWQISSDNQTLDSRSLWDASVELANGLGPREEPLAVTARTIHFGSSDQPINLVVAIDPAPVKESYQRLTSLVLMVLGAIGLGMVLLVWLQIQWSLKPLKQLRADMLQVRDGQAESLDGEYPNEVLALVNDLNKLLFHYRELLERARTHIGNLAHALKTPLSVIRNHVEQLPADEKQAVMPSIVQLQDRIDYHLSRARVAGTAGILAVHSNPAEVVDTITSAMEKAYFHRDVVLVNELDSELSVAVDARDLEEMLGNLIENAFKWASGLIRVYSCQEEDQLTLIIDDDGQGIPAEQRQSVLNRGARIDELTPGSGLGLSIVVDVVHSYRGALTLDQSRLGGLSARLSIPVFG
ncbi:ATP-binding protein [Parendozoicomonas haliclonae]